MLIAKLGELKPDTELIPGLDKELSTEDCRFDLTVTAGGRIVPPGREMNWPSICNEPDGRPEKP